MDKHEFYKDINRIFEDYMNDNNLTMFCTMMNERLAQYRIDNKLD